ncbi:MAG: dihydrofolate reductase family protein [Polyangiales bacterium]
MTRVRVFMAMSLDGFVAGPNDELDWLSGAEGVEDTFTPFFNEVGAMLMGRRTFDVVSAFEAAWPYGDTPVLVATSRDFHSDLKSVRAVHGPIDVLIAEAKSVAGDGDVYVDGGALVRSAMSSGCVDELCITLIPIVLGRGVPLFAGLKERHSLELVRTRPIGGGLVELVYRPASSAATLSHV